MDLAPWTMDVIAPLIFLGKDSTSVTRAPLNNFLLNQLLQFILKSVSFAVTIIVVFMDLIWFSETKVSKTNLALELYRPRPEIVNIPTFRGTAHL